MSDRWVTRLIILGLAAAGAACSNAEKIVVDKYFAAVNTGDNQTLSSFAVVGFEQKVDSWKITSAEPETRTAAPLEELVAKAKGIEDALAENKKAYNAYFLEKPQEVDAVRDLLRTDAKIPRRLETVAADWQAFTEKEKELKKALSEAKREVELEKRNVRLSIGDIEGIDSFSGELATKRVDLELTINGQAHPYQMDLRKYEPAEQTGGRVVSRWIVYSLEPKG
jgi:hypothetical protein